MFVDLHTSFLPDRLDVIDPARFGVRLILRWSLLICLHFNSFRDHRESQNTSDFVAQIIQSLLGMPFSIIGKRMVTIIISEKPNSFPDEHVLSDIFLSPHISIANKR
jgi:hypothetical protein